MRWKPAEQMETTCRNKFWTYIAGLERHSTVHERIKFTLAAWAVPRWVILTTKNMYTSFRRNKKITGWDERPLWVVSAAQKHVHSISRSCLHYSLYGRLPKCSCSVWILWNATTPMEVGLMAWAGTCNLKNPWKVSFIEAAVPKGEGEKAGGNLHVIHLEWVCHLVNFD